MQGGRSKGLMRRHAALHKHPQLPVRPEPVQLAVCAELHAVALIDQFLRLLRDLDVVEVVLRRHQSPA